MNLWRRLFGLPDGTFVVLRCRLLGHDWKPCVEECSLNFLALVVRTTRRSRRCSVASDFVTRDDGKRIALRALTQATLSPPSTNPGGSVGKAAE